MDFYLVSRIQTGTSVGTGIYEHPDLTIDNRQGSGRQYSLERVFTVSQGLSLSPWHSLTQFLSRLLSLRPPQTQPERRSPMFSIWVPSPPLWMTNPKQGTDQIRLASSFHHALPASSRKSSTRYGLRGICWFKTLSKRQEFPRWNLKLAKFLEHKRVNRALSRVGQMVSTTPYSLKATFLEQLLEREEWAESNSKARRERKELPIAWVQLAGQQAVTSSPWLPQDSTSEPPNRALSQALRSYSAAACTLLLCKTMR